MDILNLQSSLRICEDMLLSDRFNSIFFINAHCFNVAQQNKKYLDIINKSDLLLNDGIGIELACKINGIKVLENMNGTDFIPRLLNLASIKNKKVYLLGAKEYVVNKAKINIVNKFHNINVVGQHSGYFDNKEKELIIDEINDKNVDILILGMGVPMQEIWIEKNKKKLKTVRICIAGGAIIDFLSGTVNRAPMIMRKLKLEWIYRLINEPKRLWRRYLIGNFIFIYYIIKYKKFF
ncbi:WecB/TagA/CpsF family glycosyltransferase [Clostridium tyrobutyricum]|uniref:WecB/TagA/CpsF family glycosyltransferase n=1 Tax=Clostridium tyrobutyricum TaxID=1519 RepID=UPI001C38FC1F|nr:WecB/TagA/CpsF family glycosyltransferase [Clostridium tyrobutyricum]MBV4432328.1 WecB/TagA/CpsF family glycosyltransferase [Clostridium tyrobutyricum]